MILFTQSSRAANYAIVLEVKIVVSLERIEVKTVGMSSNCKGAQRSFWGFGNSLFLDHVTCDCLLFEKSLRNTFIICILLLMQFIHQL